MNKKTVRDNDLKGKKVLVRCDFNVPYNAERVITDNRRIVAALPTIKYLLENNCKVILCSHLGRPKGEVKPEYSLNIVAAELSKLLGQEVKLAKDVVGEDAIEKAEALKDKLTTFGTVKIFKSVVNGETLYKVRLGEFTSKEEAEKVQKQVTDSGINGSRVILKEDGAFKWNIK